MLGVAFTFATLGNLSGVLMVSTTFRRKFNKHFRIKITYSTSYNLDPPAESVTISTLRKRLKDAHSYCSSLSSSEESNKFETQINDFLTALDQFEDDFKADSDDPEQFQTQVKQTWYSHRNSSYTEPDDKGIIMLTRELSIPSPLDRNAPRLSKAISLMREKSTALGVSFDLPKAITTYTEMCRHPMSFTSKLTVYDNTEKLCALIFLDEVLGQRVTEQQTIDDFTLPLSKRIEQLNAECTSSTADYRDEFIELRKEIDAFKSGIDDWRKEKSDEVKALENLYDQKLQIKKPKDYWDSEAKRLHNKARSWTVATVITVLILLVGGAKAFFYLHSMPVENLLLTPSFIAIALISFIVYAMRIMIKIALSSEHLAHAYEQKASLTYFYLALASEETSGELNDQERLIVFQSLFSQIDSGLVKNNDSNDTSLIEAIIRK